MWESEFSNFGKGQGRIPILICGLLLLGSGCNKDISPKTTNWENLPAEKYKNVTIKWDNGFFSHDAYIDNPAWKKINNIKGCFALETQDGYQNSQDFTVEKWEPGSPLKFTVPAKKYDVIIFIAHGKLDNGREVSIDYSWKQESFRKYVK